MSLYHEEAETLPSDIAHILNTSRRSDPTKANAPEITPKQVHNILSKKDLRSGWFLDNEVSIMLCRAPTIK